MISKEPKKIMTVSAPKFKFEIQNSNCVRKLSARIQNKKKYFDESSGSSDIITKPAGNFTGAVMKHLPDQPGG